MTHLDREKGWKRLVEKCRYTKTSSTYLYFSNNHTRDILKMDKKMSVGDLAQGHRGVIKRYSTYRIIVDNILVVELKNFFSHV